MDGNDLESVKAKVVDYLYRFERAYTLAAKAGETLEIKDYPTGIGKQNLASIKVTLSVNSSIENYLRKHEEAVSA